MKHVTTGGINFNLIVKTDFLKFIMSSIYVNTKPSPRFLKKKFSELAIRNCWAEFNLCFCKRTYFDSKSLRAALSKKKFKAGNQTKFSIIQLKSTFTKDSSTQGRMWIFQKGVRITYFLIGWEQIRCQSYSHSVILYLGGRISQILNRTHLETNKIRYYRLEVTKEYDFTFFLTKKRKLLLTKKRTFYCDQI